LATQRSRGGEVHPILGVDQLVRFDVNHDPAAVSIAQKVVGHMGATHTIAGRELEPERLGGDAENVRVEIESDEMVTLTPGFKRHVAVRGG
jgi:hypothetical protein